MKYLHVTMAGNTIGTLFRLTTFGESHGPAIGGILDGCPAGITLDIQAIAGEMARRRPGQSAITTQRREADEVEFLSGLDQGVTLGTPIAFLLRNTDSRSADYDNLKDVFRPSHADFTYHAKYGQRAVAGGGRSSARETAARVVGGAIASQLLSRYGIKITGFVSRIGDIAMPAISTAPDRLAVDAHPVRCPHPETARRMEQRIEEVKSNGDTIGGIISCIVQGVPAGLGEPVFDKLSAALAGACMSINAAHGFEFGSGFSGATMLGSQHNDEFLSTPDGTVRTATNNSGGIQGGISNGMDIVFHVAFKPVSTIMKEQSTINTAGQAEIINPAGRHDPCVVPRAVPIVEAMTALTLADQLLRNLSATLTPSDQHYRLK